MKITFIKILIVSVSIICSGCRLELPPDVEEAYDQLPRYVDYNFHIKPLLADRCYSCHGPDELARKGGFRLDVEAIAKAKLESGHFALVEGNPSESSISQRILSEEPDFQMPPSDSRLTLSAREKALIFKWIEQGAEFKPHWAFIPPTLPTIPRQVNDEWPTENEVDLFIQKSLLQNDLTPSQPANKEILLKRLYMDLTGLPPSIEAIDSFLSNGNDDAYEIVVDRLLASDAAAERLAMEWMDVARYADSHGLHADGWRNAWPWRDWVIKAFKENIPYDQFITEQLAGDLLPNPTRDQILATAFHRNHPMTAEGGAIDEEFRLEYVADRTNTTATALMGLTMECARCHDHKFDPITQKDYYSLSAFFNNVREVGMTGDDGNYGPLLQLTSQTTDQEISVIRKKITQISEEIELAQEKVSATKTYLDQLPDLLKNGRSAHLPLDESSKGAEGRMIFDRNKLVYANGSPQIVEGKVGKAVLFNNEYNEIYLDKLPEVDVHTPVSVTMWINTLKRQPNKTQVLIGNAGDKNNYWRGWDFYLEDDNRLSLRFISSLPHNLIHLRTSDSVQLNSWTNVAFSYDGSGSANGARIFINGKQVITDVVYDRLYKNIRTISSGANNEIKRPLRISKSYRSFTGDNGIFIGKIDDIRIYDRILSSVEVGYLAGISTNNDTALRDHAIVHDAKIQALQKERNLLVRRMIAIMDTISEVMVMEEMSEPRPTHVLNRGQYDTPGEVVLAGTPEKILAFSDDLPKNRLGLAQWLFSPNHPLTSRATVNRYWQMIFGRGIVSTPQDFGNQGALPSHPALLDWLAVTFRENGWNVRDLLKTMVMSATYRQTSKATTEQVEKDPENIFLARGTSYRWPAEMIRDNALEASGLLVHKIGGPSVKPYQPEGLWIEKGTFSHKLLRYIPDEGEGLYRRSLYTFIKRTSPPPVMTIFDVPSRDVCNISRESTNTPLQALVLLNDPQFVEAARLLGERMLQLGGTDLQSQITYGFRLVSGRKPSAEEVEILTSVFVKSLEAYSANLKEASELLAVGAHPRNEKLNLAESAAMAMVGSTMFNMDEAYMKR